MSAPQIPKPQYKNGDRVVTPKGFVYERRNGNWVLLNPQPKKDGQ